MQRGELGGSGTAREFETNGAVHFADKEWLREPFRSVRLAMEELETAAPEPRAGIFTYTGRVSIDELEADLFGKSSPFGQLSGSE